MIFAAAKRLPWAAVLLLHFAVSGAAQPAAVDLRVEAISHGSVAVRFRVEGLSGPTTNWIEYGPTHVLGFRTILNRSSTTSPQRSIVIGGLAPDAQYYFRVVVQETGGDATATWYCPSGEAGPGYECDGPDAPPRFRTAPLPSEGLILPTLPERLEQPFPEITGQTFTVAIDEQRRCLDLQAQLSAAAAADPDRNHEVVIPAGAVCYGEHVLPRKRGPGVVVIRPSTPLDQLPPQGFRIDPSFLPLMATLSVPPDWEYPGLFQRPALSTPPDATCDAPCTEGWRLVGIEITHPGHSDLPPRHARIVSIAEASATTARVTLDRPFPLIHSQSLAIGGLADDSGLNRVWTVAPSGDRAFVIQTPSPGGAAAGGYVTQSLSLRVTGCGPGPRPVCRTEEPHGLPSLPPADIESISGGIARTPGTSWPLQSTVEVAGAPAGLDGLWGAGQAAGGFRLVGADSSVSCSGGCGNARPRRSVQTFAFDDEPRLNGSYIYSVVSETEVRLDGVEEETAESAGGYLTFDPNPYQRLVILRANSRNIVLDRCWLHGRGFPSRLQGGVAISSSDSALVDSVVSQINSWRPLTRPTGSVDFGVHGPAAAAAIAVPLGDASRAIIRNNLFENCLGITIFADGPRGTTYITPNDLVLEGNTFRNDEAFRAGSDDSNGRYYGTRHAFELKRGDRVLVEDNIFDGNWADWTPLGPAIGLLSRSGGQIVDNRIQDVTIRNNVFRRVATGIQLLAVDDQVEALSLPLRRVAIENNLFENVDFYRMRSTPSGVAGFQPSANFGGQIVFTSGSLEDLTIRRNTALDNRGRGPTFFWFQSGRSSGVQVTGNILTHNDDFGVGGLMRPRNVSQFESTISGTAFDAFRHVFTQTPNPDPRSAFARNLVLPGVRNSSSSAAYDDSSAANNFTKSDCEQFYAGFEEIDCAGSGEARETANQRFTAVFPDRSVLRDSAGRGADLGLVRALQTGIRSAVTSLFSGNASLEIRTGEAAAACIVDLAETPEFTAFRRFPAPEGDLRTVALENLESGRTYHYRVKCPSDTRFGELTAP